MSTPISWSQNEWSRWLQNHASAPLDDLHPALTTMILSMLQVRANRGHLKQSLLVNQTIAALSAKENAKTKDALLDLIKKSLPMIANAEDALQSLPANLPIRSFFYEFFQWALKNRGHIGIAFGSGDGFIKMANSLSWPELIDLSSPDQLTSHAAYKHKPVASYHEFELPKEAFTEARWKIDADVDREKKSNTEVSLKPLSLENRHAAFISNIRKAKSKKKAEELKAAFLKDLEDLHEKGFFVKFEGKKPVNDAVAMMVDWVTFGGSDFASKAMDKSRFSVGIHDLFESPLLKAKSTPLPIEVALQVCSSNDLPKINALWQEKVGITLLQYPAHSFVQREERFGFILTSYLFDYTKTGNPIVILEKSHRLNANPKTFAEFEYDFWNAFVNSLALPSSTPSKEWGRKICEFMGSLTPSLEVVSEVISKMENGDFYNSLKHHRKYNLSDEDSVALDSLKNTITKHPSIMEKWNHLLEEEAKGDVLDRSLTQTMFVRHCKEFALRVGLSVPLKEKHDLIKMIDQEIEILRDDLNVHWVVALNTFIKSLGQEMEWQAYLGKYLNAETLDVLGIDLKAQGEDVAKAIKATHKLCELSANEEAWSDVDLSSDPMPLKLRLAIERIRFGTPGNQSLQSVIDSSVESRSSTLHFNRDFLTHQLVNFLHLRRLLDPVSAPDLKWMGMPIEEAAAIQCGWDGDFNRFQPMNLGFARRVMFSNPDAIRSKGAADKFFSEGKRDILLSKKSAEGWLKIIADHPQKIGSWHSVFNFLNNQSRVMIAPRCYFKIDAGSNTANWNGLLSTNGLSIQQQNQKMSSFSKKSAQPYDEESVPNSFNFPRIGQGVYENLFLAVALTQRHPQVFKEAPPGLGWNKKLKKRVPLLDEDVVMRLEVMALAEKSASAQQEKSPSGPKMPGKRMV